MDTYRITPEFSSSLVSGGYYWFKISHWLAGRQVSSSDAGRRRTMHQIQDNFVHFFFVLDLFFLCLHMKFMYIEMLKIHFWAQIIIQTIQTAILKKHCRKSLKSALLQKIIVWAPYLKVKGSTWINIIRKHSNLKEIVESLVWKAETG